MVETSRVVIVVIIVVIIVVMVLVLVLFLLGVVWLIGWLLVVRCSLLLFVVLCVCMSVMGDFAQTYFGQSDFGQF